MYECKSYFPPLIIIFPIALLGFGIYCFLNINNPFVFSKVRICGTAIGYSLAGLLVLTLMLYSYIDSYQNIYLPYKHGEYIEVEGYVSELKTAYFMDKGGDSFKINEKAFSYGTLFDVGYQKLAANGGMINKEGLHVKVRYVEYDKELHIMYLQLLNN